MKQLISYKEALSLILSAAPEHSSENVSLDESLSRVVDTEIRSAGNIPPFVNSAMDGFAIVADDAKTVPITLSVVEEIPAGTVPKIIVTPGTCSRIMTGALVPEGATAVVPVEWTESESRGVVTILRTAEAGQHIRPAGTDVKTNDVLASVGQVITPPRLGLLAAAGVGTIQVRSRPIVAIVATGDELVGPTEELAPGKIRNSNGPALAAQVQSAGAQVLGPLVARDNKAAVEQTIDEILSADILVFAGGVSVGDYDFVQESLERRGMETVFWRVRQRPGKPLLFGHLNGKPVVGLPGNPVSASVCFEAYVRPLIEKTLGVLGETEILARIEGGVDKKKDLHYFSRGLLWVDGNSLAVKLAGPQASNVFSTMARANCIVHLPEGRDRIEDGEEVVVVPLPWFRF